MKYKIIFIIGVLIFNFLLGLYCINKGKAYIKALENNNIFSAYK